MKFYKTIYHKIRNVRRLIFNFQSIFNQIFNFYLTILQNPTVITKIYRVPICIPAVNLIEAFDTRLET